MEVSGYNSWVDIDTYVERRNRSGGISEFRDYLVLFQDTDPFLQGIEESDIGRLAMVRIHHGRGTDEITYAQSRQNHNASF